MAFQFAVGAGIIIVTIVLLVAFAAAAEWSLKQEHIWPGDGAGLIRFIVILAGISLWLLAAISISVWLWAVCLLALGAFSEFETSMYFALVSFTTLGFGDIILEKEWRILSGLMAANGLVIFGLTTAIFVDFLARLKRR
ncbi:MAG: potassium channel family protein [Hyphomicrobiales bacterium]|nr:potassium channel family protein [Hyphomicrobiales bacterium]